MKTLSALLSVACDCGRRFVALFRPPDWKAYCPGCATLYRLAVMLEKVA
jgi:hypothetical protein